MTLELKPRDGIFGYQKRTLFPTDLDISQSLGYWIFLRKALTWNPNSLDFSV